jgi:hypothetical protein
MTIAARLPQWEREIDTLWCAIELHPELERLVKDQVGHRMRALLAQPQGFVHPATAALRDGRLVLRLAPMLLEAAAMPADLRFRRWRDAVLLPLIEALCSCHEQRIVGFAPRRPVFCRGGGR